MFRQVYEFCATIFLLQGLLLPVIPVWAGIVSFRHMSLLGKLEKQLGRDRSRQALTAASLLEDIPKLDPLDCTRCGSPAALDGDTAICTNCRASMDLPGDYRATLSLRILLKKLSNKAARYWLVARALTSMPMRLFFMLMIPGEIAILMVCIIGSSTYRDTALDRALSDMGETWSLLLGISAFMGIILWLVMFVILANLARELGRKLSGFPALRKSLDGTRPADASETGEGSREFATCQSCGGGIRLDPASLAIICGYCGVANFRAESARHERAGSEEERTAIRSSLYDAMDIITEFAFTVFITLTILLVGVGLLWLVGLVGGE